jgi:hypothetical protein
MKDIMDDHEPRPEFRRALEIEIGRALRGPSRRGAVSRAMSRPRLAIAVLVLASLALGGAGGIASAQVQDSRRRDALVETNRAEAQLASVRLELARAAYEEARGRFEVGVASRASLAALQTELRVMEARAARLQLDLEEIRASAQPPRDELTAPVVNGRDFVRERLQLDLAAAQQRLTAAEDALAEGERLQRIGAATPMSLIEAQDDAARARTALELLALRLELRQQFVQRQLPPERVTAELQRLELRQEYQLAQRLHALAQERLAGLTRLQAAGQAARLEVMRAEVEVMERAFEMQRALRQMQILEAIRQDSLPR